MGSDNLQSLHRWKNYEEILNRHIIYVYPRPGFSGGEFTKHQNVVITEAPIIQISSTQIREWIKDKKDVRFFMPNASWEYLKEMHFYSK